MKRTGVTPHELSRYFDGGLAALRQILDGTGAIDVEKAEVLSEHLGGTIEFWLTRQSNYEQALIQTVERMEGTEAEEWMEQVSAPGSKPRGRLSDARKRHELRRRLAYYSVGTLQAWNFRYGRLRQETRFRTSATYSSLDGPLSLWLRQGELESDLLTTCPWDPEKLQESIAAIRSLSKISRPTRFFPKLQKLCAQAGVALVAVRAPRGCRVSGASRLIGPEKAMIVMSFRYRSDDHFWFTLFHEIGHLVLHKGMTFVDDDKTDVENDYEWQANRFASACIIPPLREAEFENLTADRDSVIRFSVSIDIAPGLTVGQMQHRRLIGYNRLNSLKRRWRQDELPSAHV